MSDRDLRRQVMRSPVHWFAFGLGVGLLPGAPGTWGSLLGVALYWLLPPVPVMATVAALLVLFVFGVWICGLSARRLGVHDHRGIVFDEILGVLIVASVVPRSWPWLLAAFAAFRLFDIWKPWPIRDVDHSVSGGLGIMLDDVLAAVYAALLMALSQLVIAAS